RAVANGDLSSKGERVRSSRTSLQNRFGIAANTGNLLRCIGRLRSARNVIAPSLQNRTSKGTRHDHISRKVSKPFAAKVGTSNRPDYRRHGKRDTAARSQR